MKIINDYLDAKANLDKFKKLESEMRIKVLNKFFPENNIGTNNTATKNFAVKGTFKNNFNLSAKISEVWDDLSPEEQACVTFKPSLKLSEYNKLDEDQKDLIDNYITVTPAMPTLAIKEVE